MFDPNQSIHVYGKQFINQECWMHAERIMERIFRLTPTKFNLKTETHTMKIDKPQAL